MGIPSSWKGSLIVPINKKGQRSAPSSYHPISLLDLPGKLLGTFLLGLFEEWTVAMSLIPGFQAGIQKGQSTTEQCFVINHLVINYVHQKKSRLFACFVDLTSALDLVCRQRLWDKLNKWGVNPALLNMLLTFHSETWARVQYGTS